MARVHHIMDLQRGSLPDIRADVTGIIFAMTPPGTPRGDQLLIRCDPEGELWISIQSDGADSDKW